MFKIDNVAKFSNIPKLFLSVLCRFFVNLIHTFLVKWECTVFPKSHINAVYTVQFKECMLFSGKTKPSYTEGRNELLNCSI